MTDQISSQRKGLYYSGMALIAAGICLFISTFISGPTLKNGPDPGDLDFWEESKRQHSEFRDEMNSTSIRAVSGIVLVALGGFLMRLGARGVAGSGLILDPKQARQDVKPWSKMAGGVIQDVVEETDIVDGLKGAGSADPDTDLTFDEKLERLHALHEKGIINEEEYLKGKAEILDNL